jgi:hypothetical protein
VYEAGHNGDSNPCGMSRGYGSAEDRFDGWRLTVRWRIGSQAPVFSLRSVGGRCPPHTTGMVLDEDSLCSRGEAGARLLHRIVPASSLDDGQG